MKKRGIKIFAIVTGSAIAVAFAAVGLVNLFRKLPAMTIKYDDANAAYVKERVENAQYLPDLSSPELRKLSFSAAENGENYNLTHEDFKEIVDTAGVLDGEGCGKYQGYDIFDIKNEIYFVLDHVPAFRQWFRMPNMREEQGYDEIPFYEWWSYYLDYDSQNDAIEVTRVCWSTRFEYYDFEKKTAVEDYDASGQESIIQYQVMKTKYYFNEQDREVVEASLYTVAVDHVKRGTGKTGHYNADPKNYYPVSFQYLKNVKDTSLTRYNIRVAERVTFDRGQDVRGLYPQGTTRDFIQMDYSGEDDIQLLRINEMLATEYFLLPDTVNIAFYNKSENGSQVLFESYDSSENITRDIFRIFRLDENWKESFSLAANLNYGDRFQGGQTNGNRVTRSSRDMLGDDPDSVRYYLTQTVSKMASKMGMEEEAVSEFVQESAADLLPKEGIFSYENRLSDFLQELSRQIIVNSELKNDWPKIFKDSDRAIKLEGFRDNSAASESIQFIDQNSSVSIADGKADFELSAGVNSSILLEDGGAYALGLVLRSESGNWKVLAGGESAVFHRAAALNLTASGSYSFHQIDLMSPGSYVLGYSLLKQTSDGKLVACSEFVPAKVEAFEPVSIPERKLGDYSIRYSLSVSGERAVLHVSSTDASSPEVVCTAKDDTVVLNAGEPIWNVLRQFKIKDNDKIADIQFYHGSYQYFGWNDESLEGENVLIVTDRSGNFTEYRFRIILSGIA